MIDSQISLGINIIIFLNKVIHSQIYFIDFIISISFIALTFCSLIFAVDIAFPFITGASVKEALALQAGQNPIHFADSYPHSLQKNKVLFPFATYLPLCKYRSVLPKKVPVFI